MYRGLRGTWGLISMLGKLRVFYTSRKLYALRSLPEPLFLLAGYEGWLRYAC